MGSDEELAKDLGLLSALTIGIGTMVGAGIFVLPGVASQEAGPVVVISFVIGGVIALVNAFAVSELGTAMPKAGGAYYYINRALGPIFGSISGLGDWMGLAFASAFYCIGFGGYLTGMLSGTFLALPTFDFGVFTITDIQLGALLAGVIFIGVNYIGAKETGGVQSVIVLLLLGILTIFAAAGLFHFEWNVLLGDGVAPTEQGYRAILPATALVFVSFLGYAKIATVAEEMKNPGRNLPIAVIGSVAFVTVLYAILVGLMVGIVPWDELHREIPVSQVSEITFATVPLLDIVGVGAVSLAALLATASSANASILSSARINFAMGRDRIVTDWLNEIHTNFSTPYRSIALTGGMIIVFILLLGQDLEILARAASVLHLIVYALINLALIAFREADVPTYDPDFHVPFYPITPILGAILSLGLILFMSIEVILLSLVFVVGAVAWYLIYARKTTVVEGVLGEYIAEHADELPDVAVSAAELARPEKAGPHRVMVPIANPRTANALIEFASTLARARDGIVHIVHIVEVPDQTPLERGAKHVDRIDEESSQLLQSARESAPLDDSAIETTSIISHRPYREIFQAAERSRADTVVMGWGGGRPWARGRGERVLAELTSSLPCDLLVMRDPVFDPERILLPTAGGPDSDLGADVVQAIAEVYAAEVTILHVVDDSEQIDDAEAFLADWAETHDLESATCVVEVSTDVGGVIEDYSQDKTLLVIGATERGLLTRLIDGSVASEVIEAVDCAVILAERPSDRSLLQRLFSRR